MHKLLAPRQASRLVKTWHLLCFCWLIVLLMSLLPVSSASAQTTDWCKSRMGPGGPEPEPGAAERTARWLAGERGASTGPAADYMVTQQQFENLTPQGKIVMCWFMKYREDLRDLSNQLRACERGYSTSNLPNKDARLGEIEMTKYNLDGLINRAPSFASVGLRGAQGTVLFYLWEIRDYTISGEFKNHAVPFIQKLRTTMATYEQEVGKGCVSQADREGAGGPGGVGGAGGAGGPGGAGGAGGSRCGEDEKYAVWLAGKDVLVGRKCDLENAQTCLMKGWGTDCTKVGELIRAGKISEFQRIRGPFNTFEGAKEDYCNNMYVSTDPKDPDLSPRVVPLTGNRDYEARFTFSGGKYLYIRNAPRCQ